ncbi:FeoA family protein [Clostridium tetani]|uniref:Ferrous iron transport protein A n=1 Tax=Clostridium tetani TaxID=1513 RepID=A0ABY0EL30_CLOTA|nr:FeoA family protein [Clostridium tetani]CDI49295.1 putative Fe2+ transport protein [Clostridium tetani 12124569]KHO39300.1 iron transporter FeoA [Clostridium tetani]QBD84770.1 ferrous iron transport protein A [Clostridium tetani]QBD87121.1 ferrous iron transport protein A [Clostridium tetani]RXI51847.1 ferrous iron transport protein A [Clostridium tetani]
MKNLKDITIGDSVRILSISNDVSKRRLMDMGLIPGVTVKVTGKAPLGDPIEILVRGYKLTLRQKEAESILVG